MSHAHTTKQVNQLISPGTWYSFSRRTGEIAAQPWPIFRSVCFYVCVGWREALELRQISGVGPRVRPHQALRDASPSQRKHHLTQQTLLKLRKPPHLLTAILSEQLEYNTTTANMVQAHEVLSRKSVDPPARDIWWELRLITTGPVSSLAMMSSSCSSMPRTTAMVRMIQLRFAEEH